MRRTPDDFAAEMVARRADNPAVAIDTPDAQINQNHCEPQDGLSQHNPPTDVISAAQEAAHRLISGESWHDWVTVGRALRVGRTQAMAEARTNKPEGKHYAPALGIDPGIRRGLAAVRSGDGVGTLVDAIDIPTIGDGARKRVDVAGRECPAAPSLHQHNEAHHDHQQNQGCRSPSQLYGFR
jgi:hypothetical protein